MNKGKYALVAAALLAFATPASAWKTYQKHEESNDWKVRAFGGLPGLSTPYVGSGDQMDTQGLADVLSIASGFAPGYWGIGLGIVSMIVGAADSGSQQHAQKAPPQQQKVVYVVKRERPTDAQLMRVMKQIEDDRAKNVTIEKIIPPQAAPKFVPKAPASKTGRVPVPFTKTAQEKSFPASQQLAMFSALGNQAQVAYLSPEPTIFAVAAIGAKMQDAYDALPLSTRLALNTKSVETTRYVVARLN